MANKSLEKLPMGWPAMPPVYDIERSYLDNFEQGPFFDGIIPERAILPREKWGSFLGHPVMVPLGVPAGPLLNGKWVTFAARMGFDIVTYKTIRSQLHPAHPLPNMIYVDTKGELTPDRYQDVIYRTRTPSLDLAHLAVTNSFGIPSRDREFVIQDIERANQSLAPGQVMIVSVVGTPRVGEDYAQDFAVAAQVALEGGAKIIEADYSCPNLACGEGQLYANPEAVYDISCRIKKVIGSVPLVIKVGVFTDKELLRKVMVAAARADAEAICGINTVSMRVVDEKGGAALGEKRPVAGICGGPIRNAALEFIRYACAVNEEERLEMTVMGTGGVTEPGHFDLFFEAGADVAMSAVGMMWDPYLAARYLSTHQAKS